MTAAALERAEVRARKVQYATARLGTHQKEWYAVKRPDPRCQRDARRPKLRWGLNGSVGQGKGGMGGVHGGKMAIALAGECEKKHRSGLKADA
jgi:hypothetical protein|eukprot:CAMPEP_0174332050 /NCGR_PEP_ID=MMETSP0810-20121108/17987_1 /TAXON_ID=73025 ORGANISM="Eutreptiella gymnastica-like, Strain CCMP1594" /NCGR_SAMPLE_ID=MMETSP0810 /ASSEMBLY_ACC=CAM_ASM_000659 /LENGTH=92 /DNA_ID=CAMNT_0015448225 /DNA_START=284 /DNA_END=562 /DNA_ORIENTATION=-